MGGVDFYRGTQDASASIVEPLSALPEPASNTQSCRYRAPAHHAAKIQPSCSSRSHRFFVASHRTARPAPRRSKSFARKLAIAPAASSHLKGVTKLSSATAIPTPSCCSSAKAPELTKICRASLCRARRPIAEQHDRGHGARSQTGVHRKYR